MKSVFVVWKDINDSMWRPVAKLTRDNESYRLNYTQGASNPNFVPFPRMQNKNNVYVSRELFAFFRNRLLPQNRPEFRKILNWSDMAREEYDELDILSITGGARQTDEFRIIAQPELTDFQQYKIRFYISGIRYLDEKNINRVSTLQANDSLQFEFEDNNPHDCNAILATTFDEEKIKVGYCPKYFNNDIKALMKSKDLKGYELTVVKVNRDAPPQYRLLCEFTTTWPKGFIPFISNDYLAFSKMEEAISI